MLINFNASKHYFIYFVTLWQLYFERKAKIFFFICTSFWMGHQKFSLIILCWISFRWWKFTWYGKGDLTDKVYACLSSMNLCQMLKQEYDGQQQCQYMKQTVHWYGRRCIIVNIYKYIYICHEGTRICQDFISPISFKFPTKCLFVPFGPLLSPLSGSAPSNLCQWLNFCNDLLAEPTSRSLISALDFMNHEEI